MTICMWASLFGGHRVYTSYANTNMPQFSLGFGTVYIIYLTIYAPVQPQVA